MRKSYHFFYQSCLVTLFLFVLNIGFAQNDLWLTSTVPTAVTVCDSARTFSLSVVNGASVAASSITVTLHLESGQKYVAGSLSGTGVAQSNITDLQNPIFSVTNFSSGTKPFSFKVASGCDLIAATGVSGGQTLQLEADLNYTTNSVAKNFHHVSIDYSKKYAALSITNVTNKNYTGSLGNTYTRVITIKNGGYGRVANFSFTTVHTPVTSITAVVGTASWNSNAATGTETYTVTNFTGVGNGDAYFDLNEIITITETVVVNQCATPPTTTQFTVMWGCNGQTCQSSIESASTAISARLPIIAFTASVVTPILCDAVFYNQQIRIQNTGTGIAKDMDLDIFRGSDEVGIVAKPDWSAFIDPTTITIKIGAAAAVPITPTQTVATNSLNTCYGTPKTNRVRLRIPSVAAGTTILISFQVQNGCPVSCDGNSYASAGWMYSATYKDECDNAYTKAPTLGLSSKGIRVEVSADGLTDLPPATSADYTFNVTTYSNNLPSDNTGYWEIKYTLSPNLVWTNAAANVLLNTNTGVSVTPVTGSRTYASNVVSIRYPATTPTLNKYVFTLRGVTLDCAVPSGSTNIQFEIIFHPSTSCATSLHHRFCTTMSIVPHCPLPCPGGMRFDGFNIVRTNYGAPDNTNDGLPDPAGVLNMAKVKTRYAMQGDTLKATFTGTVFTAGSNFDYAYASSDMQGGAAYLTSLLATLSVDRGGTIYSCPITGTKTANVFGYNVSPMLVAGVGSFPVGFQLQASDVVTLETYYRVSQNPGNSGNAFLEYTISNTFFCSTTPIVNGSSTTAASCDSYTGKYFLLRYYSYTTGNRTYTLTNCNNLVEQTDLYLGLGTCCNNFEGGNLFNSEYRPLSYYDSISYFVPAGYSYVSAQVKYYSGRGTNMGSSSIAQTQSISPAASSTSSRLNFDVANLFTSGTYKVGDEGHHLELFVTIKPDCGVASGTATSSQFVTWMAGIPTAPVNVAFVDTNMNQITYTASNFSLSSTNSYEVSLQKNIEWEFDLVDLAANTLYPNAFIAFESPSGKLSVSSLKDETTNTILTPSAGGVYPLGQLNVGHHYRMYVTNTGCGLDSMIAKSGWTCSATYPATMAAYACTPNRLALYVMKDPNTSEIQILDGTTDNVMEMCSENTFRVRLLSSKIAYVYEPEVMAIFPTGMSYVTNSAEILYPLKDSLLVGGGWRTIDNPTIVSSSASGQTVKWLMNTISQEPRFLQRGFPGVLNQDSAEFWIRFRSNVNCNFIGGSVVRYRATGKNLCGQQLPTVFDASNKNKINSVSNGYVAELLTRLVATPNMCSQPKVNVRAVFYNNSPTSTTGNDFYGCIVPSGYTYGGNFQIIRNTAGAFQNTTPTQSVLGTGENLFEWQLPSGFIGTGYSDSIVFSFDVVVPMSSANCGEATISARATTKGTANCATTPGGSCVVNVQNASADASFNLVRPVYVITAPNFTKGSGAINLSFTLQNTASVNSTLPIKIEVYEDNDNSGGETVGDNLLTSFNVTTAIPAGSSIGVSKYITISTTAGSFFLKIQPFDVTSTNCTCTPTFVWDDAIVSLPVENAHLAGLAGAKNNLLSLEVTEGINIHSFIFEKMMKNGEWQEVNKVISDETDFEQKRIIWQDTLPETKETYRAGIQNIDGTLSYSNFVELSRENVEAVVRVYPNPATDELNLAISIPATDMAHIQVMNDAGMMKVNGWQDLSQGLSIITLDASKWDTGIYFVKVQYGSIVRTQKVIILHP